MMAEAWDSGTKATIQKLPLLTVCSCCFSPTATQNTFVAVRHRAVKAGPRDGDRWGARLKEELTTLIQYIKYNKSSDSDWFTVKSNKDGTHWSGRCWYMHELLRYEFEFEFEVPATYPAIAPEIQIPELDGKTAKMYRGGKICTTIHFKPLWAKNSPHFGFAHALCLGLAPWLAAEIPHLVETGVLRSKS